MRKRRHRWVPRRAPEGKKKASWEGTTDSLPAERSSKRKPLGVLTASALDWRGYSYLRNFSQCGSGEGREGSYSRANMFALSTTGVWRGLGRKVSI